MSGAKNGVLPLLDTYLTISARNWELDMCFIPCVSKAKKKATCISLYSVL
ncbi:hypothetical protein KSI01_31820 [Kurthia sibirica]|nr:hypothetical protein KSI01_31820 [Kurthia sibirica]